MAALIKPLGLILFPQEWEERAMPLLRQQYPDIDWRTEGFDLFTFPSNLRLATFTAERFVDYLLKKYPAKGIACVLSTHEQFGALSAALLAETLGLAGTPVNAVLTAQHKWLCRERLKKVMPKHLPEYCAFHYDSALAQSMNLPYPVFVKPIKAAFSILAKKVNTLAQLRTHMDFAPIEKFIIKRLTRPFNRIAQARLGEEIRGIDGDWMIAETLMQGVQVNVDGYVVNGKVAILGTLDAHMYPGTQSFMRFELPSQLPEAVVRAIEQVADDAVQAIGFTEGCFNVELFWNSVDQSIKVIEINPRMAGQFADLYEKVYGVNLFVVLAAIGLGRPVPKPKQAYGAAASFVYREFGEAVKHAPSPEQIAWLNKHSPDSQLHLMIKHGFSRAREVKWLGDYRYALLHLGAASHEELMKRYEEVNQVLNFDKGNDSWWTRLKRAV